MQIINNLISKASQKFQKFVPDLIETIQGCPLKNYQLAAIVLQKRSKKIGTSQCNSFGNKSGGSSHAELRAVQSVLGSDFKCTLKGWSITPSLKKSNYSRSILVIRTIKYIPPTKKEFEIRLANARPCHKCLDMMKACGFKEVHYSDDMGEIITEKINHMISVQASLVAIKIKYIEKCKDNISNDRDIVKLLDKESFYDNLIKQKIPDKVRQLNFMYFIKYNFGNIPVNYKINMSNNIATIMNHNNHIIKTIIII